MYSKKNDAGDFVFRVIFDAAKELKRGISGGGKMIVIKKSLVNIYEIAIKMYKQGGKN